MPCLPLHTQVQTKGRGAGGAMPAAQEGVDEDGNEVGVIEAPAMH